MTKKMEKLVNKYYEKMDSTVSVYKMGLFDKQGAIEIIQREEKQENAQTLSVLPRAEQPDRLHAQIAVDKQHREQRQRCDHKQY